MAHFYAEVVGSRGASHRLGGKKGGASALVNSWDDGVRIYARYDEQKERNYYEVILTSGSNGQPHGIRTLGVIYPDGTFIATGGRIIKPLN